MIVLTPYYLLILIMQIIRTPYKIHKFLLPIHLVRLISIVPMISILIYKFAMIMILCTSKATVSLTTSLKVILIQIIRILCQILNTLTFHTIIIIFFLKIVTLINLNSSNANYIIPPLTKIYKFLKILLIIFYHIKTKIPQFSSSTIRMVN